MSLAPYLPPTSGETGAVMSLLQVIADPKAAKTVLDKLEQARKDIDSATAKQREVFAEENKKLKQQRDEAVKYHEDADMLRGQSAAELGQARNERGHVERIKAENDRTERRIAELRVAMDEREQHLEVKDREIAQRVDAIQKHEYELKQAMEKLLKREQAVDAREHQLAEDIAEHEAWLAGLKPPKRR